MNGKNSRLESICAGMEEITCGIRNSDTPLTPDEIRCLIDGAEDILALLYEDER